jgi:DNA repair protein RecO (recombination protein O)
MPLYTSDALVLRTYKLGEADRIVVFLTDARGKRRGVAKGARRTRSRFAGGLEPLTRARVAYFEREHRDLARLSYVEPVCSPLASQDGDALNHAGYFAELIDEWAPEGDPSPRLFRLGASASAALAAGVPVERVARYFEYWLLRLQGVYPSIVECHQCGADLKDRGAVIASRHGVFVCWECGPGDGGADLSSEALGFLRAAAAVPPERLGEVTLTPRAARELAAAHRHLIAIHLEKELKSSRVMRELGSTSADSSASANRLRQGYGGSRAKARSAEGRPEVYERRRRVPNPRS